MSFLTTLERRAGLYGQELGPLSLKFTLEKHGENGVLVETEGGVLPWLNEGYVNTIFYHKVVRQGYPPYDRQDQWVLSTEKPIITPVTVLDIGRMDAVIIDKIENPELIKALWGQNRLSFLRLGRAEGQHFLNKEMPEKFYVWSELILSQQGNGRMEIKDYRVNPQAVRCLIPTKI